MKETRKVYNGYREALLTGLEIKKKYQDSYLGAYRHRSTYLALTIPQYLDLIKIEDHREYRIFYNEHFCKILRNDTDGELAFFSHAVLNQINFNPSRSNWEIALTCPKCGAMMEFKLGRYGHFLGCSAYPDCKYTSKIPIIGDIKIDIFPPRMSNKETQ